MPTLAPDQDPRLRPAAYPRAARYPLDWMFAAHMGPNVLWLTEALTSVMDLRPGMRVLDLGCGRALSSTFLVREYGVQVWAADLWIAPEDNAQRLRAANVADRAFPQRVEAHTLPFATDFFDAVVSLDAYHYFGTDELYLGWHLLKHLKPGGQIGICVPGLAEELTEVPAHLAPYWDWQFWSFHSAAWWRRHWEKTGLVTVTHADRLPDGAAHWQAWDEALHDHGRVADTTEADMLRADAGRVLGFSRVVAAKR